MTTETIVATGAGQDRRQAAINQAARHLYDAETALRAARQSGVGAWISAAYSRLSEAIADHTRAVAALQDGAESPFLASVENRRQPPHVPPAQQRAQARYLPARNPVLPAAAGGQ